MSPRNYGPWEQVVSVLAEALVKEGVNVTLFATGDNHFDFLPLTYSGLIATPFITTINGFSSQEIIPVYKKYHARTFYVSISDSDRHNGLNYLNTPTLCVITSPAFFCFNG